MQPPSLRKAATLAPSDGQSKDSVFLVTVSQAKGGNPITSSRVCHMGSSSGEKKYTRRGEGG